MGFFDVIKSIADAIVNEGYAQRDKFSREYERKYRQVERKIDNYEKMNNSAEGSRKATEMRKKLSESSNVNSSHRRTDKELEEDKAGLDKRPTDFQVKKNIKLKEGIEIADAEPGVYIIYLNGQVMKCGRAAHGDGVRWRLRQYYNLNYDNKAREGDYWSVSPENKNDVDVSWQCCPVSKCKELEYKLFKKYGKGPWAHRAPAFCSDNSWDLLI